MCMDKETSNLIKLKMLDEFYFEAEKIFSEYFESKFNDYTFKSHINRFFDSWKLCRLDLRNLGGELNSIKLYMAARFSSWPT